MIDKANLNCIPRLVLAFCFGGVKCIRLRSPGVRNDQNLNRKAVTRFARFCFILARRYSLLVEGPLAFPLPYPELSSGSRHHPFSPHRTSLCGQVFFCAARICITATRSSVDRLCARCFNRRRRFSAFFSSFINRFRSAASAARA